MVKNGNGVYLTQEGLKELESELDELKNKKLPILVKRVEEARSHGDLSENAEYTSAREELSLMEGRVEELGEIVARAKIIKSSKNSKNVDLGTQVTVDVAGKQHTFFIVGEFEADPIQKKISYDSPIGKALMGKKIGDEVEVEAPVGKVIYKIVKIG